MLLIEDSPRNTIPKWTEEAPPAAGVAGVVLSPFTTPLEGTRYKPGLKETVDRLRKANLAAYLDPSSHVMQMPGMGDVRYYDDYDLWDGARGDISTETSRRKHIRRVFHLQDRLGTQRIAPTALLHAPTSITSVHALELAHEAAQICQEDGIGCIQYIAGSPSFWSGANLDAHVGALAQIDAAGWFLVDVHATSALPAPTQAAEVHGLCRTARAMAELAPMVHVSHGDYAALPLVAAGATSIGTGSDTRQRVCAYSSYAPRNPEPGGGGWFQRPTFEHLCGFLTRQEAAVLQSLDASLVASMATGSLHVDQPQVAYNHHVQCLGQTVEHLTSAGGPEDRFRLLLAIYNRALDAWTDVQRHVTPGSVGDTWIGPFRDGLVAYGRTEGWAP